MLINNSASPALVWASTTNFIPNNGILLFGSPSANATVNFENAINLNGGARYVNVTAGMSGAAGDAATLSAVISDTIGTGGLVKTGNGMLILTGPNTYPGFTDINGGILNAGIADTSTPSSVGTGPMGGVQLNTVNSISFGGGTLQYSSFNNTDYSGRFATTANQPISIDTNGQSVTFATALTSVGGSLTLNDSDVLSPGKLTLTGPNTYTGTTTINGGVLSLGIVDNNTAGSTSTGPLGSVVLSAANTIVFGGGTLQYSSVNNTDYSGRFSTAAGQPISIDTNGQSVTFATALTSVGGSLTVNDTNGTPGMLVLAAAETYTGGTTIKGGEIKLNGLLGSLPTGGDLTMNAGTLDLEGTAQSVGNLKGGVGALITDNQTGVGGPGSNGTTVLTVGFPSGEDTYAGKIADGATAYLGLTKNGSGTLLLSGSNTYGGPTTVNQGKLDVDGSLTSSAVTVNSGGILSGTGSLTSVTVEPGGTLAPGDSQGVMHLSGSLSLAAGAKLDYDLDGNPANNEVSMPSAVLALDDQQFSDFNFMFLAGFGRGTYTLIDASSVSGSLGLNTSGMIDGYPATLAVQGNNLVLNVVPEPSTLVLLAASALGLLGYGWRRRRVARKRTSKAAAFEQQDDPSILAFPSRSSAANAARRVA